MQDGYAIVATTQPGTVDLISIPCSGAAYDRYENRTRITVTRISTKTCVTDTETSYRNVNSALSYMEEEAKESRKYHRQPDNVASIAFVASVIPPTRHDTPCR